jgi:hypothetical protein
MELKRNLKYLMTGTDVRWVKDYLFVLGYYEDKITKITNNRYGNDTVKAVKAFQKANNLTVDGIYGQKSHKKLTAIINKKDKVVEYVTAKGFPRISEAARAAINTALTEVSEERREFVLEALKHATDASIASMFKYPSSLYIRGGNLYGKDRKTLNVITEKYLTTTYKKTYASYCTSGRLDMMVKAVRANPDTTGADCSGGIVGLLRHFKLAEADFDDTANGLLGGHSVAIKKENLTAGDYVGKSGHICIYAGGGYLIEWAGGAYGCQLTKLNSRKAWSFTEKKMKNISACNKFRKPKVFS